MRDIVIGRQFCGPPRSGNGGYVCGILASGLEGPVTAVLRAPIPLDVGLKLTTREGRVELLAVDGGLLGQGAAAAAADLPAPPPAPSLEAAHAAGRRHPGHERTFHPTCFSCSAAREEGDGLRVFVGQLDGAPAGHFRRRLDPAPGVL